MEETALSPDPTCPICAGTGRTRRCPDCGGSTVLGRPGCYELDCARCGATGEIEEHDCLLCRGEMPPPRP